MSEDKSDMACLSEQDADVMVNFAMSWWVNSF